MVDSVYSCRLCDRSDPDFRPIRINYLNWRNMKTLIATPIPYIPSSLVNAQQGEIAGWVTLCRRCADAALHLKSNVSQKRSSGAISPSSLPLSPSHTRTKLPSCVRERERERDTTRTDHFTTAVTFPQLPGPRFEHRVVAPNNEELRNQRSYSPMI